MHNWFKDSGNFQNPYLFDTCYKVFYTMLLYVNVMATQIIFDIKQGTVLCQILNGFPVFSGTPEAAGEEPW